MKVTPISLRGKVKFLTMVYKIWPHLLLWPCLSCLNSCKPPITPSAITILHTAMMLARPAPTELLLILGLK